MMTSGDYVPGLWLDGMDVVASKRGFQFAIDHCRSGMTSLVRLIVSLVFI
jgi:TPP-dependent pyruvate/acetoin dehydrogenase alpha subunit